MYICYVDESGTPELSGNTSHFVLAGLVLPIWRWADADTAIDSVMQNYELGGKEFHTAWLLRPYLEQESIANFDKLTYAARRSAVTRARANELLKIQRRPRSNKAYKQIKKNFEKSNDYIHLTLKERWLLAEQLAGVVGGFGFARLLAECIDKPYYDPVRNGKTIAEQGFEQVVSRFEGYLTRTSVSGNKSFGVVVHDNNKTVAKKHTQLMRDFHKKGTLWTQVNHIIETPLFVDSSLTGMVQVADLCAYALRRYLENKETKLFDLIFPRGDRLGDKVVGVRHFSPNNCRCAICEAH